MKANLTDSEKVLAFIAVWDGYAQSEGGEPLDILSSMLDWDKEKAQDAFEQCIAKGWITSDPK